MKKLIVMMVVLLVIPIVLAQSAKDAVVKQGIVEEIAGPLKPGGILYGFDLAFDNFRLNFAKGEARIKIAFEIADERLAETQIEVERGTPENMEKARVDYEAKVEAVRVEKETADDAVKEDVVKALEKRNIVLSNIINRFETDDNPNNDHAIDALKRAREKTEEVEEETQLKLPVQKRKTKMELQQKIRDEAVAMKEIDDDAIVLVKEDGMVRRISKDSGFGVKREEEKIDKIIGSTTIRPDTTEGFKPQSLFSVYGVEE